MEASVICSKFQIMKRDVLYYPKLIFTFVQAGSFHEEADFVCFLTLVGRLDMSRVMWS